MKRSMMAVAALAGVALVASGVAASAQEGGGNTPETIRLNVHWTAQHQVDAPPSGDSPGDLSVTAGELTTPAGRIVGRVQGVCVNVPVHNSECSFTLSLAGGHLQLLSAYGSGFSGEKTGVDAIVGGTGAYRTARGDVTDRETGPNTVEATLHVVH